MPVNYDGQFEIRFFYQSAPGGSATMAHRHSVDVALSEPIEVAPGQTFEQIFTAHHNGTFAATLAEDTDAYVELLQAVMSTTENTISHAELWRYGNEPSTDAVFISAYDVAEAGSVVADADIAAQYTMTLRSLGGNIMRFQVMEGVVPNTFSQVSPPFAGGSANLGIATALTSMDAPWLARDNTRPIFAMKVSYTQNEKLYNKRYRL